LPNYPQSNNLKPGRIYKLVTTMAFVQAMNTPDLTKKGVNGADVYTEEGVGDYRVSLFTMLNRGLEVRYIQEYITKIFSRKINDEMRDAFVMAFQTRDVRGGKGERRLFQNFISALYDHDKEVVQKMLKLVPEYGCWRDMWEIVKTVPELETDVLNIVKEQFVEDLVKCHSGQQSKMSLLAKWLPRENSGTYPGLARKISAFTHVFEDSERKRMVKYRKDTSMMNKALKTVEINMCGKSWRDIKPEAVPGRCLKIHNKAFLNEPVKLHTGKGLRFPDNEDRMECRKHFQEFIEAMAKGEKKAHGANVVMPHELVVKALAHGTSNDELAINQGQWVSIREETLKLGGLGKCVPMCDFSGSMNGLPKLISLALGILVSEINHSAFKDHILTFDAEPKWHSFAGKSTLKEKLDSIRGSLGQGLNTDFYKACMRIVEKMKQVKVPVGEEPEDLIVLTDMGFDAASRENGYYTRSAKTPGWDTQIQQIRDEFKKAGEEVWGEGNGWKPPRIVIWNLQAKYKDFHAKADQEGVVQLSGWSPSMLKALQKGGIQVMTPYMGMRAILDDERYDEVRKVWDAVHSE
jgi:hypothetical protein